ncbi:MAG: GNAT family N-acetyltransferase [Phycisphaeraceae bacterium]|nr:GNAT family N-acetyltransferase [Phycisphaerales bacterium]MCB9860214.1 GNAT family N-acetyltransferase [Phycisphaeraceae bacterium]
MSGLQICITRSDAEWEESIAILRETYVGGGYSTSERARSFYMRTNLEQHGTLFHAIHNPRMMGVVLLLNETSALRQVSTENEGEFRLLAVSPEARGLGIGRALVTHCVDLERRRGSTSVVICTRPSMIAAQHLYESMGFVRLPKQDFVTDEGSERWVYALALSLGT